MFIIRKTEYKYYIKEYYDFDETWENKYGPFDSWEEAYSFFKTCNLSFFDHIIKQDYGG